MPISFLPTHRCAAVTELTAAWLKKQNIELLMLDFDNTIVPYTTNVPTEEMAAWLQTMLSSDILVCVVSNSRNERVKKFCAAYGLDCITRAKKPSTDGIKRCLARYQIPAERAALAGDQIYTDTLGGNAAGVQTILVEAIHNHNFWLKARHVAEMPFIFAASKRRINQNEQH